MLSVLDEWLTLIFMNRLPHHFLRIWLILSLLVLPIDASLAVIAQDGSGSGMLSEMMPGMMHTSADDNASMDHQSMNHQAMHMGDKCPCQNKHCGDGHCGGMKHCANGHCAAVALPTISFQIVCPGRSGLIRFSLATVQTLVFPPAQRPPIFSLV